MANYVTYYNGQRVEITQDTLQNFLSGNPGDIGRVGQAFAGDDQNLARVAQVDHPASVQVSTSGASYAPPTTETAAGSVGTLLSSSPRDSLITGTMPPPSNTGIAGGRGFPNSDVPAVTIAKASSIPAWMWVALAAVAVFALTKGRS